MCKQRIAKLALLCLAYMTSPGIETELIEAPPAVARRREREGKSPLPDYYICRLAKGRRYAPEVGGVRMVLGTGALWRIRRTGGPHGAEPPQPRAIPIYALRYGLPALALGMALLFGLLLRARRNKSGVWQNGVGG